MISKAYAYRELKTRECAFGRLTRGECRRLVVYDGGRLPPGTIQPVTATLTPLDEAEALAETAQEMFTDVMNQFGLDPQL
ncbi:hypothetical protein [Streptomyces sp. NPDC101166]|uniref:hypothetical protein n=1 Tax=Streptomyces sp. NPDC101166 TaxID=3366120 RepID=UPI00382BBBAF